MPEFVFTVYLNGDSDDQPLLTCTKTVEELKALANELMDARKPLESEALCEHGAQFLAWLSASYEVGDCCCGACYCREFNLGRPEAAHAAANAVEAGYLVIERREGNTN